MDRDTKRKRKTRDDNRRSGGGREHKRRSEPDRIDPASVVEEMLQAYPNMASDLRQVFIFFFFFSNYVSHIHIH